MDFSPRLIKYEENLDPAELEKGFLGLITFSILDNSIILCYKVQRNKDNAGYFIVPLSTRMNMRWNKAFLLDSSYGNQVLDMFVRQVVGDYYRQKESLI